MRKQFQWIALAVVAVALAGVPSVVDGKSNTPKQGKVPKPDTVDSVDATNFSIKVSSGQTTRRLIPYAITAFTRFYVDGKPAKLEDVKKGMKVSVVSSDGKSASRIDAEEYAGAPEEKKKK